MSPSLAGLHDREAVAIAPPDTWVLDTFALSQNPQPTNYVSSLHWICRLNFGYGSTGTLPVPDQYASFAQRVAAYVRASQGCSRWVIGNEPSLSREWPDGQPIFPHQYAACYKLCRAAIHALPGHASDEVLIAASGPWNNELKYPGNPNGDWIQYFADVIHMCDGAMDGFSLHAYCHGYDTALVTSSARMDAPFQNRRYEFRTYRDYLEAIPGEFSHLPSYITEANGNGPWQAVGLMPAMLQEIDAWNQSSRQKIHSVIFYRYPHYDDFYIEGRDNVVSEYRAAAAAGYLSPAGANALMSSDKVFISSVSSNPSPAPALPPREIDPRLAPRGTVIETPQLAPGQSFWRVTKLKWYDEQEADRLGPDRHFMVDVRDKDGQRVTDVPILVQWGSGESTIHTQAKPGEPYAADFALTPGEFSARVNDGRPSETIRGIKMGAQTDQGFNPGIHTTTGAVWELMTMPHANQPETPIEIQPEPYIPKPTEILDPSIPATVLATVLNLRSGPSTGYAVVGQLKQGDAVVLSAMSGAGHGAWFRVGDGQWVKAEYVRVDEDEPEPKPQPSGDNFRRSIEWVLKWEGGYQNEPNDIGNWTGGAVGVGENKGTNFGISAASYPNLDIRNLTREQAIAIYERDYWQKSGAAQLPWPLCLAVLDTAVLHGVGVAQTWLGESGPNPYLFAANRLRVYPKLQNWSQWGKAWVNRVADLLEEMAT